MNKSYWLIRINLDKRVSDVHSYVSRPLNMSEYHDVQETVLNDLFVKLYTKELTSIFIEKSRIVSIEVWFENENQIEEESDLI